MKSTKPVKNAGFRESIRNTFLRYALYPILALVLLWGTAVLLYSFFAVQQSNRRINNQLAEALSRQYSAYHNMIQEAGSLPEIAAALDGTPTKQEITRANETLYRFVNDQAIASVFYLFDGKGALVASNTWSLREGYILETRFGPYVAEGIMAADPEELYQTTAHRQSGEGRTTAYSMVAPVAVNGAKAGYLLFDLLADGFNAFTLSKEIHYTVITDPFSNTIAANDSSILGTIGKFSPAINALGQTEMDGAAMYTTLGTTAGCPFQVYTLSSLALQREMLLFGILFIPATSLLLVLLMTRLSRRVADKNAAHLDGLIQAVEAMRQGNFDYDFAASDTHSDEFTYLSEQYHYLFKRIGRLVEANRELAVSQRLTEIRQLQAQFNPHFIFNVLETIKYEVFIDQQQAVEVINLLARLLRYSISSGGDTVTLGHDLEYIKTYLALQKIRYDDRLTYDTYIPDELYECLLPKLILQPLVENCIAHGYKNKESLHITITGIRLSDAVQIQVTDDGDGIDDERMAAIREQLASTRQETDNVGLFNSHRRLQLMYGSKYGAEIYSISGVGTEVVITFPIQRQGGEGNA